MSNEQQPKPMTAEIERLTKLQAFTQAEVKSVRNRLTNEVQPETDILDESRASLRNLAQHNHRKWIEEEERVKRLQAENDQLRQQVQHEHNLHMQEMDERRKARDEVDQYRQQLGEAKEEVKALQSEVREGLKRESFLAKAHRAAEDQLRGLLKEGEG
ncbi:hypothetical protein [Paenibacillus sp. P22]|uniref:hypothetical protein n=1 Tax=Paenibacillus sp. P22 TaxID=483908 RepID=UPI00039031F0|nr:hypothetical protein [Paenibacillus sp. P22]CDN41665.1 hypothetical protein BN871_AJ_00170 [Paenibacillus sp. P22]